MERPHMTIWRMRIACWMPKVTRTHSEYVIRNAFSTATLVARTRRDVTLPVMLPVHIVEERRNIMKPSDRKPVSLMMRSAFFFTTTKRRPC